MATYTSTQNGNWNNSATWGGGGYPSVAGDIAVIGHMVTYNVVSTVELGAITINSGGILTFSPAMSTKLTLGHVDITVNNGGELRVGASGAIIPKTYLAELIWNTTADNAKGISLANGGKLTVYGDPDYFGSDYDSVLVSQVVIPAATNAVTITVPGNFTTKWAVGQELLVHKAGTYASYTNDFCRLAITSLAINGANTDIGCTVTERPAALTCLVGADVLNVSRNVMFYKLSYNANLSQVNTLRPRLSNSNAITTSNINVNDAMFGGWIGVVAGCKFNFTGVIRNGGNALNSCISSYFLGIIFSNSNASPINSTIDGYLVNNNQAANAWLNCVINAIFFGNNLPVFGGYNNRFNGDIYANGTGIRIVQNSIVTGRIGYNRSDVAMANTNDFDFGSSPACFTKGLIINSKLQATPTFNNRNNLVYSGRFNFEHYQQIANAHYICDAYGDITKTAADGTGDNPTQRSGGSADVIEAVPQSNSAAASYLELLNIRLWAEAGVSKTYRFYVQSDFATLPTAELKLYGEYLDAGSGGHLATVSSTQDITTRANASDWSQYVEVTMNPAQTGYVNLYLRLMGYESTKKVWIDPKVVITGGSSVTVTPYWSYGEVQLDIDPVATGSGGGVSPTNLGLVPLGIKQVAV